MKFLIYIFLFLFVKVSFAQHDVLDTIWFDTEWKEISKKYANYYRTVKKTDKGFLISDYYLNGNVQMITEASQINPLIKNGKCTYYYKNLIKGSCGSYKNGKKDGVWIEYFNNGKDSSVISFLEDGTKNYIIKSKYEDIFTVVEYMPEFPGGPEGMKKFIQGNLIYPKEAEQKKWAGKTYLKFIINELGVVTDPVVLKSSGYPILDDEALRVIRLMPKWKPGTQNGKNVSVYFNLPLNFSLN